MKAIITVGLGFGDEGKGAAVDLFTRELGADLVVRYCGGAQAGHNVQLPDGRRHTFSQFGAGTFAGARTYLGPRMVICPETMVPEADHLRRLGIDDPWAMLSAHPDCLVSTAYHALMNRLRESARGNDRHGSCGLGIGETRHYWLRYGQDAVVARDLADRGTLLAKLALMRDRFLLEMQQLPHLDPELSSALHGLLPIDEAGMLYEAAAELELSSRMPAAETVVFEGAQGVLLDEWSGFHPFTTWSTVTPQHALELLAAVPEAETTVVGITRAYSTRHGAGPFPAFCRTMSDRMHDPGNPTNRWQGSIRFGPLDLVLAEYGARVAGVDGIFVSCLDQISSQPRMVTGYVGCDRIETPRSLRQQERITLLLQEARPIVTNATEQKILDRVETIAPIVGLSHGASPSERVLKTFEKGARCHSSLTPFQHTDRLGRPGDKPTCASIPSAQYLSGTHGAGP